MTLRKGVRVVYRGREYAVTGTRWENPYTPLVQLMDAVWVRASDVREIEG